VIALDLQLPSGGCRIAWVSGRPEASLVPKVVDPVLSGPTHAMPANERIDGIAVNSLEIIEQGEACREVPLPGDIEVVAQGAESS